MNIKKATDSITLVLKWGFFGSGIFFLLQFAFLMKELKMEAPKILPTLSSQIQIQGSATRFMLDTLVSVEMQKTRVFLSSELKDTRMVLSAELKGTRALISTEMQNTRETATQSLSTVDRRLELIQRDLNTNVLKIESDLNDQLTVTNNTIKESLKPVNSLTTQFAEVAPLFLDCEYNADCLFNRWVGVGRGIEQTSESVGKISNDFSILTHELTKPKPWYKKVFSFIEAGALIFVKYK